MSNEIIPISDEQAKLATKALEVLEDFGGFLREMLGTVPEDVVGLLGGDWLKVRRATNFAEMLAKARERLDKRGVKDRAEVSLTLALPLLRAAADESRTELQDLWARLLANAMDPARSTLVRVQFIDILKKMDPLDALVLRKLSETGQPPSNARDEYARVLRVSSDQVELSFVNLESLRCASSGGSPAPSSVNLTALGRQLLLAVAD